MGNNLEKALKWLPVLSSVWIIEVEIIECKSKMEVLNKEHEDLKKENAELKEKVLKIEGYKHR